MTQAHPLGTIAHLWRYPVKSLRRETLEHAEIGWDGLAGDRRRALIVASEGHARSRKTYRGKEHHLLHTVVDPERAKVLAAERGVALDAIDDGPYFDAEPVSIVVDRWVGEVERLVGAPLDPQRFRPNLYLRAEPEFTLSEGELVGRTVVIGTVRLLVVAPISRCVTPTYDVATGEANPLVLREIAQHRDNVVGVYCRPAVPGDVAVGDRAFFE